MIYPELPGPASW